MLRKTSLPPVWQPNVKSKFPTPSACRTDFDSIDTFGTGKISEEKLIALVREHFDLRPKGIVQMLDLLRPIYGKSAAYGHFGREEPEFTWERTDKAAALKAAAGV